MHEDDFDGTPPDYDPAADFDAAAEGSGLADDVSRIVEIGRQAEELGAQYAVLGALKAAFGTHQDAIGGQMTDLYAGAGLAKGTVPTPFGSVAMTEKKEVNTVVIDDEEALLAWAVQWARAAVTVVDRITDLDALIRHLKEHMPEWLEGRSEFLPGARDALLTRFVIRNGKVIDIESGQELPAFARIAHTPAKPPTPQYSATNEQRSTKMAAMEFVAARMPGLLDSIRAEIDSPGTTRLELEQASSSVDASHAEHQPS